MTVQNHVVLWERCLKIIGDNLSESSFNTFFKSIIPVEYNGKTLTLGVPSHFVCEYLEEHYLDLLRSTLYRVYGEGTQLVYKILVDKTNNQTVEQEASNRSTAVQPREIRKGNTAPNILQAPAVQDLDPRLIPNYNFENFIEGISNKLSRTAGEAVAQNPAKTSFNPLFIYGPSGVGKTHLINAIGTRIKELYTDKRVLYVSAHLFQVQYTDSVRNNTVNDFINFYQSIDVLIIDDIQEFATLTKTQNTFFHIFNHLHQTGKQLILTSDRPPVMLQGMEERLLTRFKWGLIAEMEKPNVELRKQILWSKVYRDGLKFPEKVIDYIAENVHESVRDLEGIIISLMAHSTIYNREVDIDLAERVIKKAVRMVENKPLSVEDILDKVCDHYQIDISAVFTKTRKREIVQVRQIAMYLAKKHTEASSAKIGQLIGKRDHATVLHACKMVEGQLQVDKGFRNQVEEIEVALHKRNKK
ncbi:MAG: chromosomal replication initiator protein DnaA [Bacteroidaceae bacterium]|nr:chromosomal replication initiator protein DnaA [Bacteroidaceae bacterium]